MQWIRESGSIPQMGEYRLYIAYEPGPSLYLRGIFHPIATPQENIELKRSPRKFFHISHRPSDIIVP
jgi:hypothetical protein